MASTYPATLDTFTTKTNKEDFVDADHMNDVQNAIVATQTELGADVAGSRTDLKTRLAQSLADNGAMRNGSSFPVSPTPQDGDFFYKTDENTMYIYNGSSWDAQGTSLSNLIYHWEGVDTNNIDGSIFTDVASFTGETADTPAHTYRGGQGTTPVTVLTFEFLKIAGINTITPYARVWGRAGDTGKEGKIKVDIGGQSSIYTVPQSGGDTPTDRVFSNIDVSGLSDGTQYDGVVQCYNESASEWGYISKITLIAS